MKTSIKHFTKLSGIFLLGLLPFAGGGQAKDAATTHFAKNKDVDNSEINQRDTREFEKTAEDQGSASSDIDITRKIRRSITSNSSLSTYAHNIKIITVNGEVTLKGPVRTAKEKTAVIALAKSVAGENHVKSELAIAK